MVGGLLPNQTVTFSLNPRNKWWIRVPFDHIKQNGGNYANITVNISEGFFFLLLVIQIFTLHTVLNLILKIDNDLNNYCI